MNLISKHIIIHLKFNNRCFYFSFLETIYIYKLKINPWLQLDPTIWILACALTYPIYFYSDKYLPNPRQRTLVRHVIG